MKRLLAAILIAIGLVLVLIFSLFIEAAVQGNASYGGVLLIGPIPIIFGSSPQMALASMILALVLMAVSFLLILPRKRSYDDGPERPTKIKGGAVVMIGPIPLVVGSDPRTALLLMLLALAMMVLWALVLKGG